MKIENCIENGKIEQQITEFTRIILLKKKIMGCENHQWKAKKSGWCCFQLESAFMLPVPT